MDRGAWQACSPSGCKELDTTEQLTPVVRTLHSHCEGSGLIPGQGTRRSHKPWCGPKKNIFFKYKDTNRLKVD